MAQKLSWVLLGALVAVHCLPVYAVMSGEKLPIILAAELAATCLFWFIRFNVTGELSSFMKSETGAGAVIGLLWRSLQPTFRLEELVVRE